MEAIIVGAGIVAIATAIISLYNRLVGARVRVDEAWAQIDTQLQRRHDLIPNLVETVRGYAAHETGTLAAVTDARAKAISVRAPGDLAQAEEGLLQALGKLLAIAENYPDLKADANFRQLQEELARTEDMIAGSRSHYNASVRNYDTLRQSFPSSVVAALLSFEARQYFRVEDADARRAPSVDL